MTWCPVFSTAHMVPSSELRFSFFFVLALLVHLHIFSGYFAFLITISTLGGDLSRYIIRVLDNMSTDISVEYRLVMLADTSVECRSIYQPLHCSRGAQNTHDPSVISQVIKEN